MKNTLLPAIVCFSLLVLACTPARSFEPCIGDLHSHTDLSDGSLMPDDAYDFARNKSGMCFWTVSDHVEHFNYKPAPEKPAEWEIIKKSSAAKMEDGKFVALEAFEWGTDVLQGHANVIAPATVASPPIASTLKKFYKWVAAQGGLMGFNHPSESAKYGQWVFDKLKFVPLAASQTVYIAVNAKEDLPWYYRALDQGWRVAPSGQQDTHSPDWGSEPSWTILFVGERTRAGVLDAIGSRRFFATDDRSMLISLKTADGVWMGGTAPAGAQLEIEASHSGGKALKSVQLISNGGNVAREWNPAGASTLKAQHTTEASPDASQRWYAALAITEDGRFAVSAPLYIK